MLEAVLRIRNTALSLLSILLLTNILPLPSPLAAFRVLSTPTPPPDASRAWWYLCAAELAVTALLALNMLQAVCAIKYPRAPLPPLPSPAKQRGKPPPQRRATLLSPNTSPRPQKSFSAYASSPVSTPSRVLNYSAPGASPFAASIGSSLGLSSPSPVLSTYRGKHPGAVGHAFDGSLLDRLAAEDSGEDD